MKYDLLLTESAELDIIEAFLWYESKMSNLGKIFQKKLEEQLKFLQRNPTAFQVRYRGIRIAFVKKFPFGIHYVIDENKIIVIAVFNTSKNPTIWDSRITWNN